MIPDKDVGTPAENPYRAAVDCAHAHALFFLEKIATSEAFFDQSAWPQSLYKSPQVIQVCQFAIKLHQLRTIDVEYLPQERFASWLYRSSPDSYSIGLCSRQMITWQEQTGMPVVAQAIRSVIHELGHYKLSPRLLLRPSRGPFSISATPEEEEKAWVYTFIILGILLGDYSYNRRKDPDESDDAPKVFV